MRPSSPSPADHSLYPWAENEAPPREGHRGALLSGKRRAWVHPEGKGLLCQESRQARVHPDADAEPFSGRFVDPTRAML